MRSLGPRGISTVHLICADSSILLYEPFQRAASEHFPPSSNGPPCSSRLALSLRVPRMATDRPPDSLSDNPAQSLSWVLPLIKDLTRLKPDGTNFLVWERQLKVLISLATGFDYEYLDTPSPEVNTRLDRLLFFMILRSIDESLQTSIDVHMSSCGAFKELKTRFKPRHASLKNPRASFSSLPNDVLEIIMGYIRPTELSEAPAMCFKMATGSEKFKPDSRTGLLNSIQSLGSVNRRLCYYLCRPRLWNVGQSPLFLQI